MKQGNSGRNISSQKKKKPHGPQVCDVKTEPESVSPWWKNTPTWTSSAIAQNVESSSDPATPLLGVHPRELRTHIHTETGTQTAPSSVTTNKAETIQHPSTHERINKVWPSHAMKQFLATKMNKVLKHCYNMDELRKH